MHAKNSTLIKRGLNRLLTAVFAALSIGSYAQTYEFEGGTLSGGANIQGCDACSGSIVGNLGQGGAVTVSANVAAAGWYKLQLFYATGDARTIRMTAGSAPGIAIPCDPSGGWSTAASKYIQVYLNAGTTAIVWDNSIGYAPNLDKFTLTPVGAPQTQIISFGTDNQVVYDLDNKTYDVYFNGTKVVVAATASAYGNNSNISTGYTTAAYSSESFTDNIGSGTKHTITLTGGFTNDMKQVFYTYDDKDYLAVQVALTGTGANCYKMIPLTSYQVAPNLGSGDTRAVFVPYDNDAWIRYNAYPLNAANFTASEVTNIYNNDSRTGLVIGSLNHDHWKTGVTVSGGSSQTAYVQVIAGWGKSDITRDLRGHGWVSVGQSLCESPKIMINANNDWREAFEEFGSANAALNPKYIYDWTAPKPMVWNSWGAMQTSINLAKSKAVVDFFADDCPAFRSEDGTMYVDLDSYWDNMTDAQLAEFVNYCHSHGLKAGIYWAPFVDWGMFNRPVEGSSYQYNQCWTKVNGGQQTLDGAFAMDPTHPATKLRIDYFINRFHTAGFDMIKVDFLTHASVEADSYYNYQVHTGMEAYKEGMQYLIDAIGDDMLVNAAISPNMATGPFAHTRRIACDAYSGIGDTDYTLNSTNYGWWQNQMYDYLDADNIVFGNVSEGQNRARMLSGVVTGFLMSGDDFSVSGPWQAKAQNLLQNELVMDVARKEMKWRPADGNTGNAAGKIFYTRENDTVYVAVFNYLAGSSTLNIPVGRIGLGAGSHNTKELYSNTTGTFSDVFAVTLPGSDAALYAIYGGLLDTGSAIANSSLSYTYPNPTNDHITVHFADALSGEANFAIHDLAGKQVWSATLNVDGSESPAIQTSSLAKGFYLLTVTAQGKTQNFKFIRN